MVRRCQPKNGKVALFSHRAATHPRVVLWMQIFVERKTHREDWTGEKSVKARFPIKEDKVNAFLRGDYIMDDEFQALVTKGKKTQEDADGMIQLANEVA